LEGDLSKTVASIQHRERRELGSRLIEELLAHGARYVVVAEKDAQTETRHHAVGIVDCVFNGIEMDWRYALVREAVSRLRRNAH